MQTFQALVHDGQKATFQTLHKDDLQQAIY